MPQTTCNGKEQLDPFKTCGQVAFIIKIEFPLGILGFPDGSVVKNLPAMQTTWVQSLSQEDPLEMATHSSILSWEILRTEEPCGLQSVG